MKKRQTSISSKKQNCMKILRSRSQREPVLGLYFFNSLFCSFLLFSHSNSSSSNSSCQVLPAIPLSGDHTNESVRMSRFAKFISFYYDEWQHCFFLKYWSLSRTFQCNGNVASLLLHHRHGHLYPPMFVDPPR